MVSLDHVEDGVYLGEYTLGIVSAKVEVTVKNNEITWIELLEHQHSNGHSGGGIIDEIIYSQSLQVDSVSGSTISSKVILKAVEKALFTK
ncbi:MAG: FMN-binding protein [Bacillaceae bacterium]|nr:FMN-binding protein [Bacillaceae bacterium]